MFSGTAGEPYEVGVEGRTAARTAACPPPASLPPPIPRSSARLPPGGTLHVYGSAASAGPGGCGSGCHHYTPATLPPGRGLTTLQLPGGAAVVEAFVPDGADDGAAATPALKLRVERVMRVLEAVGIHDAAAVEAGRASSGAGDAGPSPAHPNPARRLAGLSPGTMFDLSTIQQRSDATARCTPSAVCAPEFKDAAAAVISIYAINLQIGAIALCTGGWQGLVGRGGGGEEGAWAGQAGTLGPARTAPLRPRPSPLPTHAPPTHSRHDHQRAHGCQASADRPPLPV